VDIKVIAFGNLAEILGTERVIQTQETDSLLAELKKLYPQLEGRAILIAVNQQMVSKNVSLKTGDVVALMPPYSGG
jgi:molybdopterin synthase sulfur carrier subunit